MRVVGVAGNRAVAVARETHGSRVRYQLAAPLPASGSTVRVAGGAVAVGSTVVVGSERLLVSAARERGGGQELTVGARGAPAAHAAGAELVELHAAGATAEVYEDPPPPLSY